MWTCTHPPQRATDYSPYEITFTAEGRRVHAFSYVVGYSRRQCLHSVEAEDLPTVFVDFDKWGDYLFDGSVLLVNAFGSSTGRRPGLSKSGRRVSFAYRSSSFCAASSVPIIRALIFSNAVSRAVEVSSLNGLNPQSSVVPSRSRERNSAASRTRSRTSCAVSM